MTQKINSQLENIELFINKKLREEVKVSLPGVITKYDLNEQKADVMITVKQNFVVSGEIVSLDVILSDLPVVFPAASDTQFMSFPVGEGTVGEIAFTDCSLDNWVESNGAEIKSTDSLRFHDISDAFFIPGLRPYTKALQGQSSSDIVIRNKATKINIKDDGTLQISNSTTEMVAILSTLIEHLISAKVLTITGPKPFTADTIANLTADKALFDTFKV